LTHWITKEDRDNSYTATTEEHGQENQMEYVRPAATPIQGEGKIAGVKANVILATTRITIKN